MLNLNTTFPIVKDATLPGLPVLVDLNWHGQIMTSDNSGIITSRSAHKVITVEPIDSAVIL